MKTDSVVTLGESASSFLIFSYIFLSSAHVGPFMSTFSFLLETLVMPLLQLFFLLVWLYPP